MKTVKATCAAIVLALSFAIPAHADGGESSSPGKGTPVPVVLYPKTVPASPVATGVPPATGDEISLSAFADIVWALASIF